MWKDVLQRLFGTKDIRGGKHQQAVEHTRQSNILSRSLDDFDISPLVSCDTFSCVDANLRTNLDTDDFAR